MLGILEIIHIIRLYTLLAILSKFIIRYYETMHSKFDIVVLAFNFLGYYPFHIKKKVNLKCCKTYYN